MEQFLEKTIIEIVAAAIILSLTGGLYIYRLKIKSMNMEMYRKYIQELYTAMEEQIKVSRKLAHDYRKHKDVLQQMETYRMQEQDLNVHFCADEMINTILVIKGRQCREKGICFSVDAGNGELTGFRQIDKVAFLSNLLDNAIESNEKIEDIKGKEKFIDFTLKKEAGQCILRIENRVPEQEVLTFKTGKKNASMHGFGTKIITDVVRRYSGRHEILRKESESCLEQVFCFSAE